MVDRIVPATTDADRARVGQRLGVVDAWPVVTEPFFQWVVEDHFSAGRPRLEDNGVTFVSDVAPFELAKLRLLNGSHSTLAYLGYLSGFETLSEITADPAFVRFIRGQMDEEVTPTLSARGLRDLEATRRSSSSASKTQACATAPGRSRWTARKNCRSACWERSRSG